MKQTDAGLHPGHQARHALDVDFVRARRWVSPVAGLLLLAGLVVAGLVGVAYVDARDTLAQEQQRQERLQRQLRAYDAPRATARSGAPQRDNNQAFMQVQAQLKRPWDAVLRELEQLADPAIALLSLDGQGQTQRLRLVGEARNMDAVVAYLTRLRGSPWLATADLSSHEPRIDGAVRLLRFSVDVSWRNPV